jgi:hypothetical protein
MTLLYTFSKECMPIDNGVVGSLGGLRIFTNLSTKSQFCTIVFKILIATYPTARRRVRWHPWLAANRKPAFHHHLIVICLDSLHKNREPHLCLTVSEQLELRNVHFLSLLQEWATWMNGGICSLCISSGHTLPMTRRWANLFSACGRTSQSSGEYCTFILQVPSVEMSTYIWQHVTSVGLLYELHREEIFSGNFSLHYKFIWSLYRW